MTRAVAPPARPRIHDRLAELEREMRGFVEGAIQSKIGYIKVKLEVRGLEIFTPGDDHPCVDGVVEQVSRSTFMITDGRRAILFESHPQTSRLCHDVEEGHVVGTRTEHIPGRPLIVGERASVLADGRDSTVLVEVAASNRARDAMIQKTDPHRGVSRGR